MSSSVSSRDCRNTLDRQRCAFRFPSLKVLVESAQSKRGTGTLEARWATCCRQAREWQRTAHWLIATSGSVAVMISAVRTRQQLSGIRVAMTCGIAQRIQGSTRPMHSQLIWVDYAILCVIAVSALLSVFRGFVREAISLASWIGAVMISVAFSDRVAELLAGQISVPSVRIVLAFLALFVATLFAGGVVASLVGKLVDKTGLSATDRAVGMVFGIVRGIAIVAVLVLLAGLTPLPQDPWWDQSLFVPHFVELATMLRDLIPEPYAGNFCSQTDLIEGSDEPQ